MNVRVRRVLSYISLGTFYFVYGVEYAVIFPTLWGYLLRLHTHHEYNLGLAIGAYSFAGLLTAPIVGRWYDRTNNSRQILVITNLFEIAGSIMYFFAFQPWFIVLSRLVCGLASGSSAAIIAEIAQCTTVEDRTPILTKLEICRQAGLLFGPAFNLLLREFHFHIGPFEVNKYTAPGLFMAVIWVIVELQCIFLYTNLGDLHNEELRTTLAYAYGDDNEGSCQQYGACDDFPSPSPNIDADKFIKTDVEFDGRPIVRYDLADSYDDLPRDDDNNPNKSLDNSFLRPITQSAEMIETAEQIISSASYANLSNLSSTVITVPNFRRHGSSDRAVNNSDHGQGLIYPRRDSNVPYTDILQGLRWSQRMSFYADEFVRDDIVALLFAGFVSIFIQASLETMVTPLMRKFYKYEDFENSLLYLFGGIEILFVFVAVSLVSRKVNDRGIIMFGILVTLMSLTWLLVYVPSFKEGDLSTLAYFGVGVATDLLGIPPLIACSKSLFSKLVRVDFQGVGQGMWQTFILLGLTMGPLWSGAAVHNETIMFASLVGLLFVSLLLVMGSFTKLTASQQRGASSVSSTLRRRRSSVRPSSTPVDDDPLGETAPFLIT